MQVSLVKLPHFPVLFLLGKRVASGRALATLEDVWWPQFLAQMEAGDEKLWIDVFMKRSMLVEASRHPRQTPARGWVRVPAEFCFSWRRGCSPLRRWPARTVRCLREMRQPPWNCCCAFQQRQEHCRSGALVLPAGKLLSLEIHRLTRCLGALAPAGVSVGLLLVSEPDVN